MVNLLERQSELFVDHIHILTNRLFLRPSKRL